jgi:hypothetical protein
MTTRCIGLAPKDSTVWRPTGYDSNNLYPVTGDALAAPMPV